MLLHETTKPKVKVKSLTFFCLFIDIFRDTMTVLCLKKPEFIDEKKFF